MIGLASSEASLGLASSEASLGLASSEATLLFDFHAGLFIIAILLCFRTVLG